MHNAHVITCRPTAVPPANSPHFTPRLRGYDVTCRLPGGVETVLTCIAADSTIAVDQCHDAYECVIGVSVMTLRRAKRKGA